VSLGIENSLNCPNKTGNVARFAASLTFWVVERTSENEPRRQHFPIQSAGQSYFAQLNSAQPESAPIQLFFDQLNFPGIQKSLAEVSSSDLKNTDSAFS
jgi:hypothetical protein